jgi:hypothetical protein
MPDWKPSDTPRARTLRREATPAERALWEHLSRRQTGAKFSRQMPVGPWFADFLCRELALVVELDGFSHDVAPERDARRISAWRAAEEGKLQQSPLGDAPRPGLDFGLVDPDSGKGEEVDHDDRCDEIGGGGDGGYVHALRL